MNERTEGVPVKHDVMIKSRQRLEMSGVSDVTSFDDGAIVVQTADDGVSIEGENLKIEKFNAQSGEFVLNGTINGLFYFSSNAQKKKKSFTDIFK